MCGIAGVLSFDHGKFSVTREYLTRMREEMRRRGPDGGQTWLSEDGRVGLAHRRLSIVDLSEHAAQPMSNEDGTLWVSFNGEIYNHMEIRRELERLGGHRWKTHHSDTEVIVHAFEEWGIECIQEFRGMFAMAIWDGRSRELWLIRDRLGIKPLYYTVDGHRLVFASEIKALLLDRDLKRAVNEEAFYHYLSFLITPGPQTLFEGIDKLPCGTWMRIDEAGRITRHRYWDVWDHARPLGDISEDAAAEMIRAELRSSVQLRKMSDVPTGVFLSGGIDSSTNAALFSEGALEPIQTFSIGYEGDNPSYENELGYARQMSTLLKADHHERLLSLQDLLDFLPLMIELQDEPIADPVCVPLYYVCKLARDRGVTVCQVGEGADELFWGYPVWKRQLAMQSAVDRVPGTRLKRMAASALSLRPKYRDSRRLEWLRRVGEGQPLFWGGSEAFTELQKRRLIHPRLQKKFAGFSSYEAIRPIRARFEESAWEKSNLHWMSYLDLNLRLSELLLMRVDKMSMGVSLEARVPFLDHKFVELALSLPEALKTRGGVLKYILKKSVRGLIPDELIDRKKQGFGVPIKDWFLSQLGATAREQLLAFCRETEFFDVREVTRLIEENRARDVWILLNFSLWWRHYVDA